MPKRAEVRLKLQLLPHASESATRGDARDRKGRRRTGVRTGSAAPRRIRERRPRSRLSTIPALAGAPNAYLRTPAARPERARAGEESGNRSKTVRETLARGSLPLPPQSERVDRCAAHARKRGSAGVARVRCGGLGVLVRASNGCATSGPSAGLPEGHPGARRRALASTRRGRWVRRQLPLVTALWSGCNRSGA
jgi:hypothetical protein